MPIELSEVQRLLRRSEGPKLDFKREFYAINSAAKERHWNEFIKDILSLANGNVGYAGQPGYLVIGAEDNLNLNGNRELHSCDQINLKPQTILDKVNSSCYPPIANLDFEGVTVSGSWLYVLRVHPSFFLHETTRDLTTEKTTYHKGTVFVRQGESIRNATQAERDMIRNEKQRISDSVRVTSRLERRITAIERYIEDRKADLAEQRSLSTSDRYIDLEHLKDEIDFEMHILDYLKTKLRFEQSLLSSNDDNIQRGKKSSDYARKLLNEKIPRILNSLNERLPYSNAENAKSLMDEIREDAKDTLEAAIKCGNNQPRIYLLLMQIYDAKQEFLGAYEWGCEAMNLEHEFADLHRFHLRICHSVKELYEDYQEEAAMYIEQHKRRLCQILKVGAVDDWGQPL